MQLAQFLRRKQAGAYLREKYGVGSASTLAKLAVLGGGPPMTYMGSRIPVYTVEGLDTWALTKLSQPVRSTSEYKMIASQSEGEAV